MAMDHGFHSQSHCGTRCCLITSMSLPNPVPRPRLISATNRRAPAGVNGTRCGVPRISITTFPPSRPIESSCVKTCGLSCRWGTPGQIVEGFAEQAII